jgi:CBS domain-containing membrane protein
MLIQDLMSSPVVALLADQTLPLARDIMRFRHVRHLPVVDAAGRLVGLVSHRDLLRWVSTAGELRMDQVMTRDVWTVRPEMPAAEVGRTLLERQLGCAPVVDAAGCLIGIVTESDFLQVAVAAIDAIDAPRITRQMRSTRRLQPASAPRRT